MVPRNSEDLVLKEKLLHLDIFSIFEAECKPRTIQLFLPLSSFF